MKWTADDIYRLALLAAIVGVVLAIALGKIMPDSSYGLPDALKILGALAGVDTLMKIRDKKE